MLRAKAIFNLPNIIQDIETLIITEWEKDPFTLYVHCVPTPDSISWNTAKELNDYFKSLNIQIDWRLDDRGKFVSFFDVKIKSFKKYKEDSLEKSKTLAIVDDQKDKRAIKLKA